jgi:hypothetical protein
MVIASRRLDENARGAAIVPQINGIIMRNMTPTQEWAMRLLRANRDSTEIYTDNGRQIRMLAEAAGVQVEAIHVDLSKLETRRYKVGPTNPAATSDNLGTGSTGNPGK